jgi:uncharacterized phage protein (TIGR02218 family)
MDGAIEQGVGGQCTTLCQCWLIQRQDGVSLGFTDHDDMLTIDGERFEPETGLTRTEATRTLGLSIDATDVEGALASARITEEDIEAGLYDGASVTTYLVDWTQPQDARVVGRKVVGRITRSDGRFVAELESLARSLDKPSGRYVRRQCDAELGDQRCKADVSGAAFRGAGVVASMIGAGMYRVSGLEAFASGWFANGKLTFTGGTHAGRSFWIADHARDTAGVILSVPPDFPAAEVGDLFEVVTGCDKRFSTCREKFANALNFQGFPHLPGNDAAYAYVADGIEFDGGALVE